MGRKKVNLEKKEADQQMMFYYKRKNGIAKKARELSILCDTEVLLLSINPKGKADLVLGPNSNFEGVVNGFADASPKERSESKLEVIKALKKAFKGNRDHEIDAIQWGQQNSNMTEEMQKMEPLFSLLVNMINSNDHLNLMEAALKTLIDLNRKKKMEMSTLRARASAVQHLINQAEMNHPGLLNNGNPVNHGTNLLQPNMDSGSNSDTVSDLRMAAPPGPKDEPFLTLDDFFAHEGGFGAWAPGN